MADEPTKPTGAPRAATTTREMPTAPRMTKAEWSRRDHTSVTLSRSELEQLAQLVRAGHAMLNDGRSISPKLRAAMSRIGIATHGL